MGPAEGQDGKAVSPLRQQMMRDMELAGYVRGTKEAYVAAVVDLVRHYGGKRPEQMTEDEVYRYILWLRDVQKVAKGTFRVRYGGLKFLFYRTLDRNWGLFFKNGSGRRCRSDCRWRYPGRNAAA